MPISEARAQAARMNGSRSRGPSSPEGKARSCQNSCKHGLAGSGAVLPPGMRAEVEAMAAVYDDAFAPATDYQARLVRVAAFNDVKAMRILESDVELEEARVGAASQLFDDARDDEVRTLARRLDCEPADAVAGLLRTPEGCRFLARALGDLDSALRVVGFLGDWECRRLRRLLGLVDGQVAADGRALAMLRDASLLFHATNPGAPAWDQAAIDAWAAAPKPAGVSEAKERLTRAIAVRRRALLAKAAKLHRNGDRFLRAAAPAAARVDHTPEGRRRARYLAEADRRRRRALEELEALRSRGAAAPRPAALTSLPTPDADPWFEPDADELAALGRPPVDQDAIGSKETVAAILHDLAEKSAGLIGPDLISMPAQLDLAVPPAIPAATPAESPRPAEPEPSTAASEPPPCRNEPKESAPAARNEPNEAMPTARNEPGAAAEPADEAPPVDRWEARSRRPDLKELMRKVKQARKGR